MFLKFPHTPHLLWLAAKPPRADKVLSPAESEDFLRGEIVVEEKVDGANLGISLGEEGRLVVQNRGGYLDRRAHPQFQPLWPWLDIRQDLLSDALRGDLILFGEWCFAVHSVRYDALPDWLLGFDIFDRQAGRFWSADRRDSWLAHLGLATVPHLGYGHYEPKQLLHNLGRSRLGSEPMEGVYLRKEWDGWLESRAKIVRPEFLQSIEEHWSREPFRKNRLARERDLAVI